MSHADSVRTKVGPRCAQGRPKGRPKVCCAHICHHLFGLEWRRVLGPGCCGHSVAEHLSSAGFVPREVTFVGGPTRSIQKVVFPPYFLIRQRAEIFSGQDPYVWSPCFSTTLSRLASAGFVPGAGVGAFVPREVLSHEVVVTRSPDGQTRKA